MMERNVAVLPHRIRSHDDLRFRTSSVHGTCPSSLAEACLRHDGVGAGEGPEEAEEVHHKAPAWARWSLECKLELYIYIYTPNHRVFSSGFNPCVGFADSYATDQITSQVGWTADACIS